MSSIIIIVSVEIEMLVITNPLHIKSEIYTKRKVVKKCAVFKNVGEKGFEIKDIWWLRNGCNNAPEEVGHVPSNIS